MTLWRAPFSVAVYDDMSPSRIEEMELLFTETIFNDHMDAMYGDVEIAGLYYPASEALKAIDPNRYDDMYGKAMFDCTYNPGKYGFEALKSSQNRRIARPKGPVARDSKGRFVSTKDARRRR